MTTKYMHFDTAQMPAQTRQRLKSMQTPNAGRTRSLLASRAFRRTLIDTLGEIPATVHLVVIGTKIRTQLHQDGANKSELLQELIGVFWGGLQDEPGNPDTRMSVGFTISEVALGVLDLYGLIPAGFNAGSMHRVLSQLEHMFSAAQHAGPPVQA